MGLLNIWLSKALAENDRDEQRKYQEQKEIEAAQGRAAYASSLLGDSGWQTWSPDGLLGAPSGYPASFGRVPDANAWRYAPQEAARTVNNILEYQQRPVMANQMNQLEGQREQYLAPIRRGIATDDALANWNFQQAHRTPTQINTDVAATAIAPRVASDAIAEAQLKEQQRQLAIRLAAAQAAGNVPEKITAQQLAEIRQSIAANNVASTGNEALLRNEKAIGDTAIAGQNFRRAHYVFPDLAAPTGSTWQLGPGDSMKMVKMPGFENPMAGLGLSPHEQAAQAMGYKISQPQFTLGGVLTPEVAPSNGVITSPERPALSGVNVPWSVGGEAPAKIPLPSSYEKYRDYIESNSNPIAVVPDREAIAKEMVKNAVKAIEERKKNKSALGYPFDTSTYLRP